MSSLTTIEKEFGIFLKKSHDGKLRKYMFFNKGGTKNVKFQLVLTMLMVQPMFV